MVPTPQSPEHEKSSSAQTHEQRVRSLSIACTGVLGLFLVFVLGDLLARSGSQLALAAVPYVFCFGVVFLVFYMIAYISHTRLTKLMGGELPSQAALAVFFWFLYMQASTRASITINAIYGADASLISSTNKLFTFVQMFILSSPLLLLMVIYSLYSFARYVFGKERKTKLSLYMSLVLLSGAMIGSLALVFIQERFSDDLLLKKNYLIAKELDFNERIVCAGQRVPATGIFVGEGKDRVLLDLVPSTRPWVTSIYATAAMLKDVNIPEAFPVVECPALPLAELSRSLSRP